MAELEQQKENPEEPTGYSQPEKPTWHALQECQITLPLDRLLQLIPQFMEGLKTGMTTFDTPPAPTFFSNPEEGLTLVDTCSPAITIIVKGRELPKTIVDGGSGVNVISL